MELNSNKTELPYPQEIVRSIANVLHKKLCKLSHTDQCSYGWENQTPGSIEQYYYDKAEIVFDFCVDNSIDPDDMTQMLNKVL